MKLEKTIPAEVVRIVLPLEKLQELPDSAGYSMKHGRLHQSVRREGQNLVITSTGDSVQQMVEYYEEESGAKDCQSEHRQENRTAKERRTKSVRIAFGCGLAGLITGIALILFILKKRQK